MNSTTPSSTQKLAIQLKVEKAGDRKNRALQALGGIPLIIKEGNQVYKDVKGKAGKTEKEFPNTRGEITKKQDTRDKEDGDGEITNNQETRDKGDAQIPSLHGSKEEKRRALRDNPQWIRQALADSGGLDKLGQAGAYSDNWRERREQKKAGEEDIKSDYNKNSFAARRSKREGGSGFAGTPGKGANVAGKIAGAGIGAIVEGGGIPSAVFLYGLAFLNDFPDLADPLLKLLTGDLAAIVDFLFDVFVCLGFRYFLRKHLNIPGIKQWLTVMAIAEIIPIPGLDNIDILPFWTILAWVALRKIRQSQEEAEATHKAQEMQRREAVWVGEMQGEGAMA